LIVAGLFIPAENSGFSGGCTGSGFQYKLFWAILRAADQKDIFRGYLTVERWEFARNYCGNDKTDNE